MKKQLVSLAIVITMFSCTNDTVLEMPVKQNEVLSKQEINRIIEKSLKTTGNFNWNTQSAHTIWSAVKHGQNILTIGYGSSKNSFARDSKSNDVKSEIIELVRGFEKTAARGANTELYADQVINVLDIKVTNKQVIEALLKDSRVRYIEPGGYQFEESPKTAARLTAKSSSESSGCGYGTAVLEQNDYRTISPGARVPWTFDAHNIPAAWDYSTGKGITVAIIDSGLSPEQKWMNEYFNDGYSSGRTVEKYGTFIDSWLIWSKNYDGVDDRCGHGTKMAAIATAPRNDDNLPVGVAYNANLVTYRAVENVVIDDYHERKGVADALIALADRADVKVISMSIGFPFGIGKIEDAIKYAYSKGKMILAAGGTSTSYTTWYGVIFPASMQETVAVTGIMEGEEYNQCDICHTGSQIDFTVQMQRKTGAGNFIAVLSYFDQQANYIGGSSAATATTAGIAALVWAKNPSWNRNQVLQKMKESASFYPNKNSAFGYGNIDALKAVQ
ncbi:S8 family peptidase [Tenacibaculum finnmarkense]|uniref:S8 family peptidase n=1 Tax=Tenacibaculum finnmarkense TaxID=2781243 RepID=UPI003BB5B545